MLKWLIMDWEYEFKSYFMLRTLRSSIHQTYNTSCLTDKKITLLSPLKTVCYNQPRFATPPSKWNYEKLSCHPRQPGHSICSTYNTFNIWKLSKSYLIRNDNELTRAPLGYFYNATHWGGAISSPPLISETTGPILKIQAAFESPGKTVEEKQILLTSGSRVTSQVRSKSKCLTFRAWWHRRAKLRC